MECADTVLTSIGLLKDMWPSIYKCFNYHKILDRNCSTLKEKMERLKCREQDICIELQNAQYQRKKEKKEVENWFKEVQNMKDVVVKMEGEVRKRRCFSRLGFLRQSEENIKKVDELLDSGRFPEGILIDVVRDEGKAWLTTQLIGETTAKKKFEKIWTCLENGEIQSIGVWGMGGIGKTTIVTHIHNRLLENKHTFGHVYWVTVSQDSSIDKLQDAIAEKINLDLSKKKDEKIRAALLFEALQKEMKFILIFDDVWEVYPLREVGIPIGVAAGGGRIIVTTRSRDVCLRMGCKEIIKVEPLQKEEAWELFNRTLDRFNPLSQKEEEIAKDIVEKCAGLPLAIVTTARSMIVVYDIAEWRNALNELRGLVKGHTIHVENDVFKILEFSYSRLNDERFQECLLYCTLFPEDYKIRRELVIGYWIAEGLVEEMGSRQAEHDRGHAILNKLESLCLLERCDQIGEYVKMHDVVRDMAINITKKNSRFMVKTGRKLEDLPSEIEWSNNLERVSLIGSRFSSSMSVPNCPKLSTLLLQKLDFNSYIFGIREDLPNSFFMHMVGSLRVLDLSYTCITILPDSMYEMVNLRALNLFGCGRLKEVGSLAKLKELRKLDLGHNYLKTLPDGIEKLIHLQEFNWTSSKGNYGGFLTDCRTVSHLLPNLVHLQSLILYDPRLEDVPVKELSGLRKLEIFAFSFTYLCNFNSYVRNQCYQRLTHYRLQLNGRRLSYFHYRGLSKEVQVWDCRLIRNQPVLLLPANLRVLEIIRCELLPSGGLLDVSPSLKTAMDLKACKLAHCPGIGYVWWADECIASLKALFLKGMPSLRVLFKLRPREINNVSSCSSNLKHLVMTGCHNMKHLFTAELVKSHHLQNLRSIYVLDCNEMEDIIRVTEAEEGGSTNIDNDLLILCFPNLVSLKLTNLPKLKSIWKGEMTCDSLQRLLVWNCPKLRRLPLSVHISISSSSTATDADADGETRPPLKVIEGETEWWDGVEWDTHPLAKSLFLPIFQPLPSRSSVDLLVSIILCFHLRSVWKPGKITGKEKKILRKIIFFFNIWFHH